MKLKRKTIILISILLILNTLAYSFIQAKDFNEGKVNRKNLKNLQISENNKDLSLENEEVISEENINYNLDSGNIKKEPITSEDEKTIEVKEKEEIEEKEKIDKTENTEEIDRKKETSKMDIERIRDKVYKIKLNDSVEYNELDREIKNIMPLEELTIYGNTKSVFNNKKAEIEWDIKKLVVEDIELYGEYKLYIEERKLINIIFKNIKVLKDENNKARLEFSSDKIEENESITSSNINLENIIIEKSNSSGIYIHQATENSLLKISDFSIDLSENDNKNNWAIDIMQSAEHFNLSGYSDVNISNGEIKSKDMTNNGINIFQKSQDTKCQIYSLDIIDLNKAIDIKNDEQFNFMPVPQDPITNSLLFKDINIIANKAINIYQQNNFLDLDFNNINIIGSEGIKINQKPSEQVSDSSARSKLNIKNLSINLVENNLLDKDIYGVYLDSLIGFIDINIDNFNIKDQSDNLSTGLYLKTRTLTPKININNTEIKGVDRGIFFKTDESSTSYLNFKNLLIENKINKNSVGIEIDNNALRLDFNYKDSKIKNAATPFKFNLNDREGSNYESEYKDIRFENIEVSNAGYSNEDNLSIFDINISENVEFVMNTYNMYIHDSKLKALGKINFGTINLVNATIVDNNIDYLLINNNNENYNNKSNLNFYNSIIYNNKNIKENKDDNNNIKYENSLLWDESIGREDKENIYKDPLLYKTGELTKQSPAINIGNNDFIAGVYKDIRGFNRILGGRVDLGAFETDLEQAPEYKPDKPEEEKPDKPSTPDTDNKEEIPDYRPGIVDPSPNKREKIDITIRKNWDSSTDIKNIKVHIYKNNSLIKTINLSQENNWEYILKNMDKYNNNGSLIIYRAEEEILPGYLPVIENIDNTITITNYKTDQIAMLNDKDHFAYIQGYKEDVVRPENNITRGEVAAIFFRLLDNEYREKVRSYKNDFSDLNKEFWANKHISTLVKADVLSGYPDNTFRANDYITRGELAAVVLRFDKLEATNKSIFTDIKGHWAEKYIDSAVEKGWVIGYDDNTYRPDEYITRAELVTLVNNVLNRNCKKENMLLEYIKNFKDLKEDKWYYQDFVEASNSHEYEVKDNIEKWIKVIYPDIEM